MNTLIHNLSRFNRKERFHLIGLALGNPRFTLSSDFRTSLQHVLGTKLPAVEGDAFVAMDYHLDWLFASLYLAHNEITKDPPSRNHAEVSGTQEDLDCIIAYEVGDKVHVILLEAKGATRFSNRQMTAKADRLAVIFGPNGKRWLNVIPHFVIASPRRPLRLNSSRWPGWMRGERELPWIKLDISGDWRVVRCDPQGRPTQNGGHWTVPGGESHAALNAH